MDGFGRLRQQCRTLGLPSLGPLILAVATAGWSTSVVGSSPIIHPVDPMVGVAQLDRAMRLTTSSSPGQLIARPTAGSEYMPYKPEAVGSSPTSAIPSVSRCSSVVERRKSLTTTSSVFFESCPTAGAEYIGKQPSSIPARLWFSQRRELCPYFRRAFVSGPTAGSEYIESDVRKDVWVQIPPASQDAVAKLANASEKL